MGGVARVDESRDSLMRLIGCSVVCLALWCTSAPRAYGQAPASPAAPDQKPSGQQPGDFRDFDELNLEDLLNVTVSIAAGRVQRAEEAPSIVSVVTDEDIRRMGARTLADVLETVPGFEVLTDALGRNHIAVRGIVSQHPANSAVTQASSENILVLFNGHRLNDHFTGGATVVNLDIPLYNIKQVEIVRGPGSALFGANAFLAVINLVPYTARNFEGVQVSAAGGSFDTQLYHVLAARTLGDFGVSASFQFSDTSGPRLLVPQDAQTFVDAGSRARSGLPPISLAPRTTSGDRRGVDFSLNAAYKGFTANARVRDERSDGFIGFKDRFGWEKDQLDSRQILFDVGQTFRLTPRTTLSAKASFTQNEVRDFLSLPTELPDNRTRSSDFSTNSRRYAGEIGLDQQISATNRLAVGVGYETESTYDPQTSYQVGFPGQAPMTFQFPYTILPVTSRKIASAFAQDTWEPTAGLGLTAGVRYDRYNDFGSTVNPRAGIVWRLPKHLYVKALYGRAFRAPTLTELFVDFSFTKGNPDLKPSTINTVELALGYKDRNAWMGVTYFTNRVRDFIAGPLPLVQGAEEVYFVNTPDFSVRGIEIDLKRTFGFDHAVFANYSYQKASDPSIDSSIGRALALYGASAGDWLPSHLATLGLTAGIGRHLSITPTALLRGQRPRHSDVLPVFIDRRPPIPAYGVVNLNVRVKELFDRLEVAGTIGNLFDKRYVDPAPWVLQGDYPRPGRNGLLTVTYKF